MTTDRCTEELNPPLSITVRVIVYEPFDRYVCEAIGFDALPDDVPSPKLHEYETMRLSSVELLPSKEQ